MQDFWDALLYIIGLVPGAWGYSFAGWVAIVLGCGVVALGALVSHTLSRCTP